MGCTGQRGLFSFAKENSPLLVRQQRHALHHRPARSITFFYTFVRSYETTTRRFGSVPMENVVTPGVSWSAVWMTWRS